MMHTLLGGALIKALHLKQPSCLLRAPQEQLHPLPIRPHPLLLQLHSPCHIEAHPPVLQQRSQLHIQLHPHLQPLYPWQREQALLVRGTLPVEWTCATQRHQWHLMAVNLWHPALLRLVSMSRLPVRILTPLQRCVLQQPHL